MIVLTDQEAAGVASDCLLRVVLRLEASYDDAAPVADDLDR